MPNNFQIISIYSSCVISQGLNKTVQETILKKKFLNFSFLFFIPLHSQPPKKNKFTGTKLSISTITYRYLGFALQKSGDYAYQESKGAVLEPLHSAQEVLCITSCHQGLSPVGRILFCLLQFSLSCLARGCTKEHPSCQQHYSLQ